MLSRWFLPSLLLSTLPLGTLAADVLSTSGFSTCIDNATVQVNQLNVTYNRDTRVITFDVDGSSTVVQNVTASLIVEAYGKEVYSKDFNPCSSDTYIEQLCPVPATSFSAHGEQTIPSEYANQIPSIAFSVPDLDGTVKVELKGSDGQDVACVESTVSNGKTVAVAAVSYAAAGVAGAALVMSAISAVASGGHPGTSTSSPGFMDVMSWFQSMSMNGMLSVNYPTVYRQFSANFAFSTGLVRWGQMQTTIDSFRASTGGNLTDDNYEWLKNNATLVYDTDTNGTATKRSLDQLRIFIRDEITTSLSSNSTNTTESSSKQNHVVSGIEAYVEQLSIPQSNTFMTVLLVWCIVVAAIIVFILLLKLILEAWGMCGKLSKSMESWRQRYWWRMAKALTNLILLLYGSWTLYCVYQFTLSDSWAAKVLAGITLGLFTAVLAGFTWRIIAKARQFKKMEGDAHRLYEDKETWIKYSLFYDQFKKQYFWLFIPCIIYMFAKGCIIAGASGHGLIQTAGQLIVESLMFILLLWTRPYNRPSGMWINIIIQGVRVASVVCILVFVEELGISQTTQTITGVVLIVVQSTLTGLLAILIAVNAVINCCRENPYRKQRKDQEKWRQEYNLTPLDARNSLLMEPGMKGEDIHSTAYKGPGMSVNPFAAPRGQYAPVPRPQTPTGRLRSLSRPSRLDGDDDNTHLMSRAARMGHHRDESASRSPPGYDREPRLPDLDLGTSRLR